MYKTKAIKLTAENIKFVLENFPSWREAGDFVFALLIKSPRGESCFYVRDDTSWPFQKPYGPKIITGSDLRRRFNYAQPPENTRWFEVSEKSNGH